MLLFAPITLIVVTDADNTNGDVDNTNGCSDYSI